jgi:hypothetical protein
LYNGRYTFTTDEDQEVFIVNLEIFWDIAGNENTATTIVNQSTEQQYEMEVFTG